MAFTLSSQLDEDEYIDYTDLLKFATLKYLWKQISMLANTIANASVALAVILTWTNIREQWWSYKKYNAKDR